MVAQSFLSFSRDVEQLADLGDDAGDHAAIELEPFPGVVLHAVPVALLEPDLGPAGDGLESLS